MSTTTGPESVLTFVRDGVVTEQPLTNTRMLIGRADGCEICFPFNQEISRLHASLSATDEGWRIEDVTSRSGTFVNGDRVLQPRPLHDNDVVRIGSVQMTFRTKKHAAETMFGSCDVADVEARREQQQSATGTPGPVQTAETTPVPPQAEGRTPPPPGLTNHYAALGIPNFESNISQIHDIAKERLLQLRQAQDAAPSDDRAAEFEDVSAAMICLTNRRKKRDYDQQLANRMGIEFHVTDDRVIPLFTARGFEAAFLVAGLILLGVIAWFVTPWLIQTIHRFFAEVQRSIPSM